MTLTRRLLAGSLALLCLAPAALAQGAAAPEPLAIDTKGGRQTFTVEVMRNDEDRARGLMFRRSWCPRW